VSPPSWRHDLNIWQDFSEEVARFTGIDTNLKTNRLPAIQTVQAINTSVSQIERAEGVKDRLVELGFHEVLTYSFVSKTDLTAFGLPNVGELANAMNPTLKYLRPSILPNLAQVLGLNNLFDPILVFEIGHVFLKNREEWRVAVGIAGGSDPLGAWLTKIADAFGIDSAALKSFTRYVQLDDRLRQLYKIRKKHAVVLELPLSALEQARRIPYRYALPVKVPQYKQLSKFPPVTRDLALAVNQDVTPRDIARTIETFHPAIESVQLFDEFVSQKLGEGKKSLAYHIFYADPSRTLTVEEVEPIHAELQALLERSFDAKIR